MIINRATRDMSNDISENTLVNDPFNVNSVIRNSQKNLDASRYVSKFAPKNEFQLFSLKNFETN